MIITKLFKDKLQQQISHALLPGLKRLAQFRSDFPGLENHISHSYISSYLGITNVSLSRLSLILKMMKYVGNVLIVILVATLKTPYVRTISVND